MVDGTEQVFFQVPGIAGSWGYPVNRCDDEGLSGLLDRKSSLLLINGDSGVL